MIPILGVPMIQLVIANLRPACAHRFIFICQREHHSGYGLDKLLPIWAPGSEVVLLDGVTDGAACTVLQARGFIDNDDSLMIANSDQYIDASIDDYLSVQDQRGLDGLIMTMTANDPKWSFAATDADGLVTRVAEKDPISDYATVGIYNFKRGSDFVKYADEMIAADERVNGEFYVAPVYNRMIAAGRKVGIHGIGTDGAGMHGLGTPTDLDIFLALPLASEAVGKVGYGSN